MHSTHRFSPHFPLGIQIAASFVDRLGFRELRADFIDQPGKKPVYYHRELARRLNSLPEQEATPVRGGELHLYALLTKVFRFLAERYTLELQPAILPRVLSGSGFDISAQRLGALLDRFSDCFPPGDERLAADHSPEVQELEVRELFLLRLASENRALERFRALIDDRELAGRSDYLTLTDAIDTALAQAPPYPSTNLPLPQLLRAPIKASPNSLAGQVEFIRNNWRDILPPELMDELLSAMAIMKEEEREFWGGPGMPQVLDFLRGGMLGREEHEYPEYERYSLDAGWMANVVMIAKMTHVWLDQLSKKYGRSIQRLDQIPDEELDRLAGWGFTALWLIGVWERSQASQKIKRLCGNPEAISSAYSVYDYVIAADLGGEAALENLKWRCGERGIRLASDMVPNHTGLHSKWTVEHPDWFVQLDYPPYPAYSFNGPDLSFSPEVSLHLEDGYWNRTDAAVVFKHYDHRNGRTRYIYHGNDGTSTPWNDTAQLNYLLPAVREAVIRTIVHVARMFPVIRFDAAMTLAKKHYQRLWFPQPGLGSGVPSRAEHGMSQEEFDHAFPEEFWREVVDRVAVEAPDTLLLAEAFWLMEGYFVRTLGMHRVYNSAFMNMLKMEENSKYRQTVKNVLEFDPQILKRFVNFMNNPDERTAIEQFGKEDKYIGACALLVTMPGLPMFGHGQVEGFHEKYGMEYSRSYWDEPVDEHLLWLHEQKIFPLVRRRHLFSGSENFVFYDFWVGPNVNEDVFVYSNRSGTERGLILFNNRYARTAGWIRSSTSIGVKKEGGETLLIQKTLGDAFGLNPDSRCYYAFRDYGTGLEYLRPGAELCDRGLFMELGAYQYYAFLDFREIWDDEFGNWGKLCYLLAGEPAASLDEEFKQVRFKRVNERFREVLAFCGENRVDLHAPEGLAAGMAKEFAAIYGEFLGELRTHLAGEGDQVEIAHRVADDLKVCGALAASIPAKAPMDQLADEYGQSVLLAYLLLRKIGKVVGDRDEGARSAELLRQAGLDRALLEFMRDVASHLECVAEPEPQAVGLLIEILSRWYGTCADWSGKAESESLAELFSDPLVREFLLVNTHGGTEWFNRERFELLAGWLGIAALIQCAPQELEREAEKEAGIVMKLCEAAQKAGYRVKPLVSSG